MESVESPSDTKGFHDSTQMESVESVESPTAFADPWAGAAAGSDSSDSIAPESSNRLPRLDGSTGSTGSTAPPPPWLTQALELRAANPGQPPAVLVNLLYAKGVPGLTGAAIKAALADHDQQQPNP